MSTALFSKCFLHLPEVFAHRRLPVLICVSLLGWGRGLNTGKEKTEQRKCSSLQTLSPARSCLPSMSVWMPPLPSRRPNCSGNGATFVVTLF